MMTETLVDPQLSPELQSTPSKVDYSASSGLLNILTQLDASLVFSSYQSSLVYFVGLNQRGGLHVHQLVLPKPMGVAQVGQDRMILALGDVILEMQNVLKSGEVANSQFDACFAPRVSYHTGHIDSHDVSVLSDGRPIFVNTRFNCLACPTALGSFQEYWRPPFISALVDEDRCHLNGLAMENGTPRYVTTISRSDTIDGWRDRRADGGTVIDVQTNEILCTGLSMPHSPRLINGQLWVLNSGAGELGIVHTDGPNKGRFEPKAFCPGFTRGLAIAGTHAFVGLSKPRYKRFEGLALDDRLNAADSDPWCGVQVIDTTQGNCMEWFRIDGAVQELYDVTLLRGYRAPMAVAPGTPEAANLITPLPLMN